jgi:hypothetical protein
MKRKYFNCVKFKIVGHSSKGIKPLKKKERKKKEAVASFQGED